MLCSCWIREEKVGLCLASRFHVWNMISTRQARSTLPSSPSRSSSTRWLQSSRLLGSTWTLRFYFSIASNISRFSNEWDQSNDREWDVSFQTTFSKWLIQNGSFKMAFSNSLFNMALSKQLFQNQENLGNNSFLISTQIPMLGSWFFSNSSCCCPLGGGFFLFLPIFRSNFSSLLFANLVFTFKLKYN